MAKSLFITGTGTDVGKTYVTGLIVKKLRESGKNPGYYKAAMSGNDRRVGGTLIPGDAVHVKEMSGTGQPLEGMCPYVYETAVSPHLASRIEGNPVRLEIVEQGFRAVCKAYDYITMEGSGGIFCPICFDQEKIWQEDIIKVLGLPCLIIADAGLGTINQVVLTVEYMQRRDISVKGIVFNHFHPGNVMEEDNLQMCQDLTGVKVLACVQKGSSDLDMDPDVLASLYE